MEKINNMAQSIILTGPNILLYINNTVYKVAQSINFTVDYSEEGIYGIDCPYPQEIAGGRCTIRGSVKGLRVKYNGGLQASNLRPLFTDLAASPYVSIRVTDRSTGEDIILLQNAKVTNEQHSVAIKGTYKLNFDFVGQIPFFALDRSN
jgi:hypothetical protein